MDGLEAVTSITSLNGVDCVGGPFAGNQTEVLLGRKGLAKNEAVVAVARLLSRSRTTLTRLDLRCVGKCEFYRQVYEDKFGFDSLSPRSAGTTTSTSLTGIMS